MSPKGSPFHTLEQTGVSKTLKFKNLIIEILAIPASSGALLNVTWHAQIEETVCRQKSRSSFLIFTEKIHDYTRK